MNFGFDVGVGLLMGSAAGYVGIGTNLIPARMSWMAKWALIMGLYVLIITAILSAIFPRGI